MKRTTSGNLRTDKDTMYPAFFVEDIIDLVLLKAPDQIPEKIRKHKTFSAFFQPHSPDRVRREYPSLSKPNLKICTLKPSI